MFRTCVALIAAIGLSACTDLDALARKPEPIGEFSLCFNAVVAPNLVKGPASREASEEEWVASIEQAIDARFRRFEGTQLYHFGVSVNGYVLAHPGVPVVLSPKSAVIITLSVWDDAESKKLNEEPKQITVLENIDGASIVGSGLTKTAEQQMEDLSFNAAALIEKYLREQHKENDWFALRPVEEVTEEDVAEEDANDAETDTSAENAESPEEGDGEEEVRSCILDGQATDGEGETAEDDGAAQDSETLDADGATLDTEDTALENAQPDAEETTPAETSESDETTPELIRPRPRPTGA